MAHRVWPWCTGCFRNGDHNLTHCFLTKRYSIRKYDTNKVLWCLCNQHLALKNSFSQFATFTYNKSCPLNWCSTNTTTLEDCPHKLSFELMPSASITTQHAIELKNNNDFVIMPNLPSSTWATTILLLCLTCHQAHEQQQLC